MRACFLSCLLALAAGCSTSIDDAWVARCNFTRAEVATTKALFSLAVRDSWGVDLWHVVDAVPVRCAEKSALASSCGYGRRGQGITLPAELAWIDAPLPHELLHQLLDELGVSEAHNYEHRGWYSANGLAAVIESTRDMLDLVAIRRGLP